jgi:hypothetical protein
MQPDKRESIWTLNEEVIDVPLSPIEKRYLLLVERGDVASTKALVSISILNQEI